MAAIPDTEGKTLAVPVEPLPGGIDAMVGSRVTDVPRLVQCNLAFPAPDRTLGRPCTRLPRSSTKTPAITFVVIDHHCETTISKGKEGGSA